MPLTGTLRSWNDDRGFGFIAPTHGGPELFVHISAFPADASRPTPGETLSYELGRGKDGRPQAIHVVRSAVGRSAPPRKTSAGADKRSPRSRSRHWTGSGLMLLLLFIVGAYGYGRYKDYDRRLTLERMPATSTSEVAPARAGSAFRCDGRTTCSQMTSCAEAKWFINNCPGTKMDGDHDGLPCERQWCN